MKKTYTFSNGNGTFICFLDYEEEADFETFLTYVCERLGIDVPPTSVAPYSLIAEIAYENVQITASCNTDAGCYLRLPLDSKLAPEAIVQTCYGEASESPNPR
jgi:hypothetical protein